MVFAHDTEQALAAAVALVNTDCSDGEKLPDIPALDAFLRTYGWTGRHEHSQAELQSVRELRPRLRRIWDEDEDGVVAIVNRLLRDSNALPQLVRHLPAIVQRFRWIAELPAKWHQALPGFLAEIERFRGERIEDYDLPNLWSYLERVNAAGTRYFLPNIAISIGHGVDPRPLGTEGPCFRYRGCSASPEDPKSSSGLCLR